MKASDEKTWRAAVAKYSCVAFGKAPIKAGPKWPGRPEKVKHEISVAHNGFRYFAFASRDDLKTFLSAVPMAREVVNPAP